MIAERRDAATLAALALLLALVPFEPRQPVLHVAGFELTLLEGVAALVTLVLLVLGRERLPLLRRPPLPLVCLWSYALAHLFSAALVEEHSGLAPLFALRMVAAAAFASVVMLAPEGAWRAGLLALAATAAPVALLAALEAGGVTALDPFLDHFRPWAFTADAFRRGSAGSENPNLAAAMLMYGLLAGTGLASRITPVFLAWVFVLATGLLCTYSRGGILAALVGLFVLAAARGGQRRQALIAAAVVAAVAVGFAAADTPFRLRATTPDVTVLYGARYAPTETALALAPGEARVLRVTVTNSGGRAWPAGGPFYLSAQWLEVATGRLWNAGRAELAERVDPGASRELDLPLVAPAREGRHALVLDMAEQAKYLFSNLGVPRGSLPVSVSRSPGSPPGFAVTLPAADEWIPRRTQLWRIALAMWRAHPWLGVGPDNFRRLYGPWVGRRIWDERTFASSLPLEVAATTGSLGLIALLATLAAVLRVAWRSASPEAGALLAMAAGFAAHGAVDYVLAFTGHYLVLGFLVGASAALGRRA